MDEDKIKCIQEWPQPESQEEMRKFLGLCGYYRNYIKEYAKIVAPLQYLAILLDPFVKNIFLLVKSS
jgi:hypothetical protein